MNSCFHFPRSVTLKDECEERHQVTVGKCMASSRASRVEDDGDIDHREAFDGQWFGSKAKESEQERRAWVLEEKLGGAHAWTGLWTAHYT